MHAHILPGLTRRIPLAHIHVFFFAKYVPILENTNMHTRTFNVMHSTPTVDVEPMIYFTFKVKHP